MSGRTGAGETLGSESDALTIVAELAVAIAGFAGIVVSLRGRVEDLSPMAAARLWRLVETSLATALFALLPLAFHHLGLPASQVWSLSSGLFAAWLVGAFVALIRRSRGVVSAGDVPWTFNAVFLGVLVLAVAALLSNALGAGSRAFGPYFAALLGYLALAGLVFARLLLARN